MGDNIPTLNEVTGLEFASLETYDIAILNLAAANGLPSIDDIDVEGYLATLDEWAEQVRFEIRRHIYQFEPQSLQPPTEFTYGTSLGRFFCWFMLQVLQEDCGVTYHPDRKFNPDFCNPEDVFMHGIVDTVGQGGTCASMPVVYVAVGRRLGLPVFLVQTRGHVYFRWDDSTGTTIDWTDPNLKLWIPPDRFNVEGSGEGIAYYPDSHYIQWPELWEQSDFEHGRYLRSLSAKEELADFLVQRAECWRELGNWMECEKAIYHAVQLAPDDDRYKWLACKWADEYQDAAQRRARIEEMEREWRERLAAAEPSVPGHSLECHCQRCNDVKKIKQSRPSDHGTSCRCRHCEKIKILQGQSSGMAHHGPSCQCLDCRNAREFSQQSAGLPGHQPNCKCAGCLHSRNAQPGQPNHAIPGQPVRIPQPHIPGMSQPHVANPHQRGLPGFCETRPTRIKAG